jgi:hypothetical protein
MNADFFQTPGGTTVGAHVTDGRPLIGPGIRPVFGIAGQHYWTGVATLRGFVAVRGDSAVLSQVNRPLAGGTWQPAGPGVFLFTSWYGDTVAAPALGIRVLEGDERSGRGVITVRLAEGTVTLRQGEAALRGRDGGAAWLDRRNAGDTITWSAAVMAADSGFALTEVVGAFPMMVLGGENVVARQTGVPASFGPVRHPRSAVGWSGDGQRLYWVVVDGRQVPYSAGMTLDELAVLFLRIGASHAINLDGGGSSALVVQGRVVNRPSDAQGERAVGNALALESCRPR